MPCSVYWPLRQKSHSPTAQLAQGTGSGRRTMPTTRSPLATAAPAGASSTRPSDSCPRTRRSRAGRRPAVGAREDLGVGAADADGEGLDEDRTVGLGRFVDVGEVGRPCVERDDGERLHARPPWSAHASRWVALPGDRTSAAATSGGCGRVIRWRPTAAALDLVVGGRAPWVPARLARGSRAGRPAVPTRPRRSWRSASEPSGEVMAGQAVGGVDERDVREGLREVADEAPRHRVVLLGEEAEVVAQREQALEERPRVVDAADQVQAVGEPERAGEERALAPVRPSTAPSSLVR